LLRSRYGSFQLFNSSFLIPSPTTSPPKPRGPQVFYAVSFPLSDF
jgi:hypothetical protein